MPKTFWKLRRKLTQTIRPAAAPSQTERDRLLAARLCADFEQDLELADIRGIHFYVREGRVTLYGVVHDPMERDLLCALVEKIPGVRAVIDRLEFAASA